MCVNLYWVCALLNCVLFFVSKCHILSASGLRLVELRTDPGGLVFHHWEFLHETPPLDFTLKRSRVKAIPEGTTTATVMAEDTYGNILKKRVKIDDFEWSWFMIVSQSVQEWLQEMAVDSVWQSDFLELLSNAYKWNIRDYLLLILRTDALTLSCSNTYTIHAQIYFLFCQARSFYFNTWYSIISAGTFIILLVLFCWCSFMLYTHVRHLLWCTFIYRLFSSECNAQRKVPSIINEYTQVSSVGLWIRKDGFNYCSGQGNLHLESVYPNFCVFCFFQTECKLTYPVFLDKNYFSMKQSTISNSHLWQMVSSWMFENILF